VPSLVAIEPLLLIGVVLAGLFKPTGMNGSCSCFLSEAVGVTVTFSPLDLMVFHVRAPSSPVVSPLVLRGDVTGEPRGELMGEMSGEESPSASLAVFSSLATVGSISSIRASLAKPSGDVTGEPSGELMGDTSGDGSPSTGALQR
jgi:hypothetical protein